MTSQLIGPSSRPYIAGLSRRQLHRFYATTREAPAAAAANIQKSDAASEMTDAGQQVAVTAAPSKDKAAAVSASPSTAWMKKQMDQMSFLETRKQKPAMKAGQDSPFAMYVPPQKPQYGRLELEKWAIFYWAKFNNWRQSILAGGALWGGFWVNFLRRKSGTQRRIIQEEIVPLYKRLCAVQAAGDIQQLQKQLSGLLYQSLRTEADRRRHRGLIARWKWHGLNSAEPMSTRLFEQMDRSQLLQTIVRLDTQQSIELIDSKYAATREPSSAEPRRVIENYIFQKRLDDPKAEWRIIKAVPTLTDLQAIGILDPHLRDLGVRKRKRSLTLVA